jgi:hypothetical protein
LALVARFHRVWQQADSSSCSHDGTSREAGSSIHAKKFPGININTHNLLLFHAVKQNGCPRSGQIQYVNEKRIQFSAVKTFFVITFTVLYFKNTAKFRF